MKLGKRPPKNAPALQLGDYLTGQVPAHPSAQDNLAGLSNWQMLGNDTEGDCVAVTWANFRRVMTAKAGAEFYPPMSMVSEVYATQNPNGEDNGMDIQTLLEYLVNVGGPDGVKALGFAKVNHSNQAEVDAALSIFGGVWTGMIVQNHNRQEFADGQPWTYDPNDSDEGGHSVLDGGYTAEELRAFLTWAQETAYRPGFDKHQVDEMWVVIWPELLGRAEFQAGINLAALAADYTALTGKEFPVSVNPTPEPTPAPTPTPAPAPEPTPTPEPPAPTPDPVPPVDPPEPPIPPAPEPDPVAAFIDALEDWAEGFYTRRAPLPVDVALMDAIVPFMESQGLEFEVRP